MKTRKSIVVKSLPKRLKHARGKQLVLANESVKPPPQKQASDVPIERVLLYLRSRFNPIRRLTPELLSVYLDRSKIGFLREIALVWDAVAERDDKIMLATGLRKKSVSRYDYQIEPIDGLEAKDEAQMKLHKQTLEYFYANLTVTRAIDENERGGVKMLVRQMMDAVGSKYSVHEIVWQPKEDGNLTAQFRWTPLWFFENLTGRLRYLTREGETYGVDLDEGGWMITVGDGLMYALLILYIFKTLPLRDWVTFSERNGMPSFLGKTPSQVGSAQWEAMADALRNIAADFAAVMNTTDAIEVLDLKGKGGDLPYPPLVEWADRAIVSLLRGGDLSTMSSGKGTQGHGSQRQDEEADCLLDDDVEMIDETMHQWVTRYVIEYVHGDDRPLARYKTVVPPDRATAQDIATDEFLVGSNVPLGVADAYKRYGRVPPKPGEELMKAPQQDEQLPPNLGNERRLANERRAGTGKGDPLFRAALGQLTPAQATLLRPLVVDLKACADGDAAGLKDRIGAVAAKIPALLADINVDPPTAKIIERGLVAEYFNGRVSKPK